LGGDLRINFAGRDPGITMASSMRKETGGVFSSGRRVIGNRCDRKGVFSFFWSRVWIVLLGEKNSTHRALVVVLVFLGSWLSGSFIVATDDGCSTDGLRIGSPTARSSKTRQLLGSAAETSGVMAVTHHDAGRSADRMLRDGGVGRVLFADKTR